MHSLYPYILRIWTVLFRILSKQYFKFDSAYSASTLSANLMKTYIILCLLRKHIVSLCLLLVLYMYVQFYSAYSHVEYFSGIRLLCYNIELTWRLVCAKGYMWWGICVMFLGQWLWNDGNWVRLSSSPKAHITSRIKQLKGLSGENFLGGL